MIKNPQQNQKFLNANILTNLRQFANYYRHVPDVIEMLFSNLPGT